jgi:peptide-methionine (S)-S-oxide reductase
MNTARVPGIVLAGALAMMAHGSSGGAAQDAKLAKATFAGGCFWCTEAVYAELKGVKGVTSGYIGGSVPNPTYEQVCGKKTGHAEAIEIEYDPAQVSFQQLLEVFFTAHDPTTKDRQGHDVGPQYRSAVFYHDAEQKRIAEDVIRQLDGKKVFPAPIVTEVVEATTFYPAEGYHQDYFAKNPADRYCNAVALPKMEKVRKAFKELVK